MADEGEVLICHVPGGNAANAHTIAVDESAVDTHLDHGDTLGLCVSSTAACVDPVAAIERIVIHTREVEVVHSDTLEGADHKVTVDTQPRTIELFNRDEDTFVAQYQVPVGFVWEVRIFPEDVEVHTTDGAVQVLTGNPNLRSWRQSGWKYQVEGETPIEITEGVLSGGRGLFDLPGRVSWNGPHGYSIAPTAPLVMFEPNPPADGPGVFVDQLTVIFDEGSARSDVDVINAEIGATVVYEPEIGTAYRVHLPVTMDAERGVRFYQEHDGVALVLPGVNYGMRYRPSDAAQPTYDQAGLVEAWNAGAIGSRKIRVGVIDPSGIDMTHPDLYLNVGINQGEIVPKFLAPICDADDKCRGTCDPDIRQCLRDIDGDGLITFTDLNVRPDPNNATALWNWDGSKGQTGCALAVPADTADFVPDPLVCDWNENDRIDVRDFLGRAPTESPFFDTIDNDDDDPDDAITFADDVFGWDFSGDGSPDAQQGEPSSPHGTMVAGLVGARPLPSTAPPLTDVFSDMVGAAWEVSLVPLAADGVEGVCKDELCTHVMMPDTEFLEAVQYVEHVNDDLVPENDIDVVVTAIGWTFVSKRVLPQRCARSFLGATAQWQPMPGGPFEPQLVNVQDAIRRSPYLTGIFAPDSSLYVFAAGNDTLDLSDTVGTADVPASLFKLLFPQNVLVVGNSIASGGGGVAVTDRSVAPMSNFGPASVVDLWAPGQGWTVPIPGGGYQEVAQGTSLSAPIVAGAAVLVLASDPYLSPAELAERLRSTAVVERETVVCTQGEDVTLLDDVEVRYLDARAALP